MLNPKAQLQQYLWVAGSLIITFMPFINELPIWIMLSMMALVAVNIYLKKRYIQWPKGSLIAFVITYCVGIYYQYGAVADLDVATVLLITMLTLKFLESNNTRELSIVILLTFVLTLAKFLYAQSLLIATYMIFLVWFNSVVLISLNAQKNSPTLVYKLKLSMQILLQAIPVMLILFVLFPRLSAPLWGTPKSSQDAKIGLGDTMSPGQYTNLTKSSEVAFRVKFDGAAPPQNKLYWRGPVLWNYDGVTWTHGERSFTKKRRILTDNQSISYTVTMQPSSRDFIFALDMPAETIRDARINQEHQLIYKEKITTLKQYSTKSYLNYKIDSQLPLDHWQFSFGLNLPEGYNPKTIAYGQSLRDQYKTDQQVVNAALRNYNNNNFYYTLNSPRLGRNFADDFLFKSKRGFCEHYSSTFVITMRAAGIPARVVTGYLGGEMNNRGANQYMIVRQSDAHAWAEVWLEDQGWVRVDPTGAVAPDRVEKGIDAALADDEGLSFFSRKQSSALKSMQMMWDSINNQWDYWVLGYGPENQKKLLENLGLKWSSQDMIIAIMILSGTIIMLVFLFLMYQTRSRITDPALKLYTVFLKKCTKKGVELKANEGASDFAIRISQQLSDEAEQVVEICQTYQKIRYGKQYTEDNLKYLKKIIKNF